MAAALAAGKLALEIPQMVNLGIAAASAIGSIWQVIHHENKDNVSQEQLQQHYDDLHYISDNPDFDKHQFQALQDVDEETGMQTIHVQPENQEGVVAHGQDGVRVFKDEESRDQFVEKNPDEPAMSVDQYQEHVEKRHGIGSTISSITKNVAHAIVGNKIKNKLLEKIIDKVLIDNVINFTQTQIENALNKHDKDNPEKAEERKAEEQAQEQEQEQETEEQDEDKKKKKKKRKVGIIPISLPEWAQHAKDNMEDQHLPEALRILKEKLKQDTENLYPGNRYWIHYDKKKQRFMRILMPLGS